MTKYLFDPPANPIVKIAGEELWYPVRRVFCVGRNYEAHAKEMGAEVDREEPWYFNKSAHMIQMAIPGTGTTQPYPPCTENYHHEMEMVVAMGKGGFRIPKDKALDYVYGYACGLDMTRRDLQQVAKDKRRPWDIGKDVENAAVMGEIVPVTKCGHPKTGRIWLTVNGEIRQDQDLADLIWSVPEIISHLSKYYHLEQGDLIYSGTPSGVGPVVAGDKIEGHVEGLPSLEVTITPAE